MRLMICCGICEKRKGMLGVSLRRMKALTVQMDTVTVIGKGTPNLTYFMYYVHEIQSTILFS